MNYIILIFYSIILPIISLKPINPKLCINCKYFISDNDNGKDGKCSFLPKRDENYLVNGINEEDYYYCSTARKYEDMCGEEGKYYKKKYILNKKSLKK
jgi:hypothetical protein